ncbi:MULTISPECIES: diacylglycerol kinase [Pseudanabaena]|uniref:Diacylglycerol kinase n=2 Tax=Pseudanabaena TaxID=1152 RepID=L8MWF9_9CYAN|nr:MULTISPECIES: diacylglycerol kinase [Pseudanabaena]ELS31159.1 diacylglycerol kinase [Pseudanabaena biceps PCC 7429]MDG3496569.1 diacylglycerol kinase [Pseudanabaena catenata USMAC16]
MPKLPKSKYDPIRKLKVIFSGLHFAVSDFSVAYKLVLSVPIFILTFILQQWVDVTLILLATGMMLVAELFNSAIEILCDFVQPQEDRRIGIIKDIAASAAGVSIFVWAATILLESNHLWKLYKLYKS